MNDIIDKVRLINPEAADWLDANRNKLRFTATNLGHLMTWRETPQGYDFWHAIRKQLKDDSPEAQVSRGAAWLDRHYPGWARSAEGARVISDTDGVLCRAVPGHGSYTCTRKHVGLTAEQAYFLGLRQTDRNYQQLWDEQIQQRLNDRTSDHPFTIHSDGSVSYGSDTMTAEQVEATILAYRRKKAHLGVIVQSWHPKLVYSHLEISCQRFPIEQIEAFIAEYEARLASVANTMVKRGGRVRIDGEEYIVAAEKDKYALICIDDGLYWQAPITSPTDEVPLSSFFTSSPITDHTIEVL